MHGTAVELVHLAGSAVAAATSLLNLTYTPCLLSLHMVALSRDRQIFTAKQLEIKSIKYMIKILKQFVHLPECI